MDSEAVAADPSIAHQAGAVPDALRFGLAGVKSDVIISHPVKIIQENAHKQWNQAKHKVLETTYGSAFPMKLDIERQILSRFQRPPGSLPSSMLGLESMTGSLEDFGFQDFLNDPRESETFAPIDMHHGMEVRLGLSKGPACRSFM